MRFAAAIAALTGAGAFPGGATTPSTSVPGVTGRQVRTPSGPRVHSVEPGVGVDSVAGAPSSVTSPAGVRPPPAANAPAGKTTATITPIANAIRAFQPTPWDCCKTDLLCRPTGLAVGLALKGAALPP